MNNNYMRSMIDWLNDRTSEYDKSKETVSDKEWDMVYFDLQSLEESTGIIYPDSPTQKIHYEVKNELEKVKHNHPLLSLAKTKSIEELEEFVGDKHYCVMAKMDGLTVSVRYIDGKLVSAETRGDGKIGENILHNAKVIKNLPQEISYKDELIIDGEAIITYEDFAKFKDEYANPRNLVSGSIRLLSSEEASNRNISFVAWKVYAGFEDELWYSEKLRRLDSLGFTTVPRITDDEYDSITDPHNLKDLIEEIKIDCENKYGYPTDGIVIGIDSIEEAADMGPATAHHERFQMAYKFVDETVDSQLLDIEFDVSRRGILTPVARFNPIELEGSTVEKATLSNLSVMEETLGKYPYVGQRVSVAKMNQIIPKILDADKLNTPVEGNPYIEDITTCPICGGGVEVREDGTARILYCTNPQCPAKLANQIVHYCSKKALDIKGISRKTIDFLIDKGWLTCIKDLYNLEFYSGQWKHEKGWGERSVEKILAAIKESRNFNLQRYIVALGIAEIGSTASKEIIKKYPTWESFRNASYEGLIEIEGFGDIMVDNILNFDYTEADEIFNKYMIETTSLSEEVEEFFQEARDMGESAVSGKKFVITGTLSRKRADIVEDIERVGGKVTGSVSKNTDFLIINDLDSTSSKAVKARQLGTALISEEELYEMINE